MDSVSLLRKLLYFGFPEIPWIIRHERSNDLYSTAGLTSTNARNFSLSPDRHNLSQRQKLGSLFTHLATSASSGVVVVVVVDQLRHSASNCTQKTKVKTWRLPIM
jgi:hypothetical protein